MAASCTCANTLPSPSSPSSHAAGCSSGAASGGEREYVAGSAASPEGHAGPARRGAGVRRRAARGAGSRHVQRVTTQRGRRTGQAGAHELGLQMPRVGRAVGAQHERLRCADDVTPRRVRASASVRLCARRRALPRLRQQRRTCVGSCTNGVCSNVASFAAAPAAADPSAHAQAASAAHASARSAAPRRLLAGRDRMAGEAPRKAAQALEAIPYRQRDAAADADANAHASSAAMRRLSERSARGAA